MSCLASGGSFGFSTARAEPARHAVKTNARPGRNILLASKLLLVSLSLDQSRPGFPARCHFGSLALRDPRVRRFRATAEYQCLVSPGPGALTRLRRGRADVSTSVRSISNVRRIVSTSRSIASSFRAMTPLSLPSVALPFPGRSRRCRSRYRFLNCCCRCCFRYFRFRFRCPALRHRMFIRLLVMDVISRILSSSPPFAVDPKASMTMLAIAASRIGLIIAASPVGAPTGRTRWPRDPCRSPRI